LLDLDVTASEADITKAYKEAVKKYHPDRHHSHHFRDLRVALEQIFNEVQSAHDTLSDPFARRRYDATLRKEAPRGGGASPSAAAQKGAADRTAAAQEDADRKAAAQRGAAQKAPVSTPSRSDDTAKECYMQGKRHFDTGNMFDAIQCLREAVRLSPSKPSYRKLLAQALVKNPRWRGEAQNHFQKVLDADPCDAECYLGLGEIYAAAGMTTRAQRMFDAALKSDPSNKAAKEKVGADKGSGVRDGLRKMLRLKKKGSSG
jgi:curved DNA-binding protein CbpA